MASLRLSMSPARSLASNYGRQLRHIIIPSIPIVGSLIHQCPPGPLTALSVCADDSASLHPHGLLTVGKATSAMVRCDCVFSPTKWISRRLSARELGDAYDLPQAYLSLFDDVPPSRLHTLSFLGMAPTKLLRAFVISLLPPSSVAPVEGIGPPRAASFTSAAMAVAHDKLSSTLRCRWLSPQCNIFLWWFSTTYGMAESTSPAVC
mmetsp:Transcript_1109/g.1694  ORF Transcript_1109/g.1694 Transcript_1109/m.1694 type:complete len:206 (-) Transcript_1109:1635-2252(-)